MMSCGDAKENARAIVRATIIDWDGENLPEGLRLLSPGAYLVEQVEDVRELTPEEEAGIMEALDDLDAGHGIPLEQALREIRAGRRKKREGAAD